MRGNKYFTARAAGFFFFFGYLRGRQLHFGSVRAHHRQRIVSRRFSLCARGRSGRLGLGRRFRLGCGWLRFLGGSLGLGLLRHSFRLFSGRLSLFRVAFPKVRRRFHELKIRVARLALRRRFQHLAENFLSRLVVAKEKGLSRLHSRAQIQHGAIVEGQRGFRGLRE